MNTKEIKIGYKGHTIAMKKAHGKPYYVVSGPLFRQPLMVYQVSDARQEISEATAKNPEWYKKYLEYRRKRS